ncbi:MAG: helix-turn-helix domain-containing protein [Acidimicrobiia bacterium]|nr:helix-turn-helix domain-containing protein [Acidimicrobiia bacterium]
MTMIQMTVEERPQTRGTCPDIDLVGPLEACEMLVVDESELLELVNSDQLSAYRLGGHIRFRAADVVRLARTALQHEAN